jgi:CHAD domain-containing protein
MAYRLKAGEPVGDAITRIAREQIRRAIAEIDDAGLDRHATIHQVRKRCKKVRGLLRMVRPALGTTYEHENACFRDAAGQLSRVRDAQTLIETLDGLASHFASALDPDFAAQVREQMVTRRREMADHESDLDDRLRSVRRVLAEADERSAAWELDETGFAAIAGGVGKTYRRGRKAMAEAYDASTTEAFHEWRKRTKYFWYQQRLLRPLWPAVMKARCATASALGDLLGDDHDLAVLAETLVQEPERFGTGNTVEGLLGLVHRRRLTLQQQARPLGERLFAEKPDALVARLERYWCAWQRERQERHETVRFPGDT